MPPSCTHTDGSRSFRREYDTNVHCAQSNVPAGRSGGAARYDPAVQRHERHGFILERIASNGKVTVRELADELNVSTASVRRDLEFLEDQKSLARTHGGAVAHGVIYELPLRYRAGRHEEEKRRIAAAAATRVAREGAVVGLTGGTTTTEVARQLVDREQLTVVTNALNIATELVVRPSIKLVVTGGVVRERSYELCGPLAEATLATLNIDVVFVGVTAISVDAGCTTQHEVEAHTDRVLLSRARQVVVVADSSKVGEVAFAQICPLSQVDELITDRQLGDADVAELEAAGVRVTRV
jgi:DeoR family transcriptional regulator, aga operon transcriptional repressor